MIGRPGYVGASLAVAAMVLLACLGSAAVARGEVVQEGGVRISYDAALRPAALPRAASAPAAVTFAARLSALDAGLPPRLRRITIALNRHGHLDTTGLPVCRYGQVQASSDLDALRACRRSLVGEGRFAAQVLIPDQAPFPSRGRLLAFYGRYRGRPAILAHVYGTEPLATTYTIPFFLRRSRGTFGTVLTAPLGGSIGKSGFITLLRVTLGGRFGHLRARCPAPAGSATTLFPLASLSIGFPQRSLRATLLRSCRVR